MTSEAWIGALTSLIAAVIGAAAAVSAIIWQARHQTSEDHRREEDGAIEEVLVRSSSVVLRSNQLAVISPAVGSIHGLLARLARVMVPVDFAGLLNPMYEETIALERAAARVRLSSDPATIASAEAVVSAAMALVEAHAGVKTGKVRWFVVLAFLGRRQFDTDVTERATADLAQRRQELVNHVRTR
ncbi:hypothetical protein [Nocardioides sp. ChNu-99]|uniref:hypothetical protein n=1 Tax=Nocardioides sp. ChNu-99 TaxID=2839897 RepID=UPI002405949D|nr:hypothetical protein [Nocardioides sp. ChNu-99]MDF9716481.1 hypothetical protein [Nocardioides sp. ChNu-99]